MDPEPYDVLAVELSSFQLHYTASMSAESAAVLNVAEDHLDWYAPDRMATTPPTRARVYERRAAGLRLQRRRPEHRAAGPRGRRRARARAPSGFTLGMPGGRHARRRRGPPRRPGLHRGADDQRRRAVHARRPRLARPRTSSPTRWPRPRWPGPTACSQAAVRDGLRAFRPDGHRIATVADARRRDLGRRLQGHQPARRPVARCRPTTPSSGSPAGWPRAPGSTTWSRPCGAGCGASCCSAGTATSSPTPFRDTRPMCPSSRSGAGETGGAHGARRRRGRPARPAGRHGAAGAGVRLAWTCSPTTAHAATRSPRRCDAGRRAGPD